MSTAREATYIAEASYATKDESRVDKLGSVVSPQGIAMAALMLLLQYSATIRDAVSLSSPLRSIPLTLLFLGTLGLLLCLPHNRIRSNTSLFTSLFGIPILLMWVAATISAYLFGRSVVFPNRTIGVSILVITTALVVSGFLTKKLWVVSVALMTFCGWVAFFQIRANEFEKTFLPGRPISVIQTAITNLRAGTWPYLYQNVKALPYFPFLVIPYVPFGWLKVDLRWASVCGAGLMLLALWITGRKVWNAQRTFLMVAVFLSPAFLYHLLTTQLSFYWLSLLLVILAASHSNQKWQRSALLLACLSRQLAWPLLLPAAIHWMFRKWHRTGAQRTRLDWSFLRLSVLEVVAISIVIAICLVHPKSFYWSTFVFSLADGHQAAANGIIQTAGSIALTPLLPFAIYPRLTLLTAAGLATIATACLVRSGLLFRSFARSLIIVYVIFLSFGFMVHNYYWVDVIVMILAYEWVALPRSSQNRLADNT